MGDENLKRFQLSPSKSLPKLVFDYPPQGAIAKPAVLVQYLIRPKVAAYEIFPSFREHLPYTSVEDVILAVVRYH